MEIETKMYWYEEAIAVIDTVMVGTHNIILLGYFVYF
jgi:hypothetical protein